MAFVKQQHQVEDDRGKLFWNRSGDDGAPFRGPMAPLLKEEEFEQLAERVYDTKYGVFNTADPDQELMGRTLAAVLDGSMCGLYQILFRDHRWGESATGIPTMFQYIEWAEPYQELPSKYYSGASNGATNGHSQGSSSSSAPPLM
jgi:hypothetical protein